MPIAVRRSFTLFGGLIAACGLLVGASVAQEHAGPHWTYRGATGPDHWADLDAGFGTCQLGHRQSPIDIRGATPADLPPIQFAYQPTPLHIVNNGHTIQVTYAPGSFMTVGDKKYELKQFHFHHPSEEHVNGRGYAMVAHLVHADAEGQLAVVGVLLEAGAANPVVESVWQHLPSHEGPEQSVDGVKVDAAGLLPAERGYYTFAGSLTTPPCSEGVTWFVLKTPEPISQAQADAFGRIFPANARPIQPLSGREVMATK